MWHIVNVMMTFRIRYLFPTNCGNSMLLPSLVGLSNSCFHSKIKLVLAMLSIPKVICSCNGISAILTVCKPFDSDVQVFASHRIGFF
uniref:Uncharacterized protein n=1 Tax=Arundo donax TaxID=35708 RepID=A0A0A8Y0W0_ARUDO